jgi:hypothetical protein
LCATLAVESYDLLELWAFGQNDCCPFKAVPLSDLWIDDVNLNGGILPEICSSAWRTDVCKDQMLVVPDGGGAFGRQVWSSIPGKLWLQNQAAVQAQPASCPP